MQLPQEYLEEMKAGGKEKWKAETSSSLLVTAEPTGIAKIMMCEHYNELPHLLRVTTLILQFVKIMKSGTRCSSRRDPLDQGDAEVTAQES